MKWTLGMIATVLLSLSALTMPASAQLLGGDDGLLGGLTGGGGDDDDNNNGLLGIIGGSDDDALVTIGSGNAGSNGAVNVGLGGGGGNVVNANVLPGESGSVATVRLRTRDDDDDDALNVNAGLLNNTVTGEVGVGGSSLATVNLNVGGGSGGGNGGNGGNGGSGGNGGAGGNGGTGGTGVAALGNSSQVPIGYAASCADQDAGPVLNMIAQARSYGNVIGNWSNPVDVTIVGLCADLRDQAMSLARANGVGNAHNAAAANPVVSAALAQRSRSSGDILAYGVERGVLQIYVR